MNKYKELKYKGEVFHQKYQIEEILVKEKMGWFLDLETYNVRLEISEHVLILNSGTIYNGIWEYGVIRSGEIVNITFKNGVIFNVVWRNGIFEDGIIFNGTFYHGQFLKGKLRTTNQDGTNTRQEFIDCDLSPALVKI